MLAHAGLLVSRGGRVISKLLEARSTAGGSIKSRKPEAGFTLSILSM